MHCFPSFHYYNGVQVIDFTAPTSAGTNQGICATPQDGTIERDGMKKKKADKYIPEQRIMIADTMACRGHNSPSLSRGYDGRTIPYHIQVGVLLALRC